MQGYPFFGQNTLILIHPKVSEHSTLESNDLSYFYIVILVIKSPASCHEKMIYKQFKKLVSLIMHLHEPTPTAGSSIFAPGGIDIDPDNFRLRCEAEVGLVREIINEMHLRILVF